MTAWCRSPRASCGVCSPPCSSRPIGWYLPVTWSSGSGGSALGNNHSVALKSDGSVWTWGENNEAQLGNGSSSDDYPTPAQVPGLTGMSAISAGQWHTLALKSDGSRYAWGTNSNGRLGDNTTTERTSPTLITGITNVIAIAAGGHHSVALKSDGTVWAWGANSSGQLGQGGGPDLYVPTQVPGLASIVAISAGTHSTVAVSTDGSVWSWGSNSTDYVLGDGTIISRPSPEPIAGPDMNWKARTPAIDLSSGTYFTDRPRP